MQKCLEAFKRKEAMMDHSPQRIDRMSGTAHEVDGSEENDV